MRFRTSLTVAAIATALSAPVATTAQAAEIEFWHAMGNRLNELLDAQVAQFNASQDEHTVVATNKGNYSETLNAGIAAFRAGEQPTILQVFEVGTATMMNATGAIKPVYELMEEKFIYSGRRNEGGSRFHSGECALFTESSAGYAGVKANAEFDFSIAPLPYYDDIEGAPQNTIIGGASLWVMQGKSDEEYAAAAAFLNFLAQE